MRAEMISANSHVSPVIDLDRLNIISIENNIDNGGLQDSDMSITTRGSGYVNVETTTSTTGAYYATVANGGSSNAATAMVHVELTMNVVSTDTPNPTLASANGGYNVSEEKPAAFIVGEAVPGH